MITDLEGEILSLPPGTHACLLHWTEEERRSAVESFLRDGLALGDRCMLVVDESARAGGAADIDRVAGFADSIAAGALTVLTTEETYLPDGSFDPEATMALLDDEIGNAPALGSALLRATGEMTWALPADAGGRLIQYEAALTERFAHRPTLLLCQYDCSRFPAKTVLEILLVHPVVVARGHVYRNPFVEDPDAVPSTLDAAAKVEWIMDELEARRRKASHDLAGTQTAIMSSAM